MIQTSPQQTLFDKAMKKEIKVVLKQARKALLKPPYSSKKYDAEYNAILAIKELLMKMGVQP